MTTCANHGDKDAITSCEVCLKPICNDCISSKTIQPQCRSCGVATRRKQQMRSGIMWLVILSIVGTAGVFAYQRLSKYEPPFDYGELTGQYRKLAQQHEREPCDLSTTIELGELQNQARDYRGALKMADAFFAKCGDRPRLRWVTYTAYKYRGDFEKAAEEATALIEDRPYDKDFPWWRGIVREKMGDVEGAAADYAQTMALCPRCRSIPLNLAAALEKLGRPCEALGAVERMLYHHPKLRRDSQISERLASLRIKGDCFSPELPAEVSIKLDQATQTFPTEGMLNNKVVAPFIIDTGASFVAIGPKLAQEAGFASGGTDVRVKTAGGERMGRLVVAKEISIRGLAAKQVEVIVLDDIGPEDPALLGVSFLSRFASAQKDGVMTLKPR